MPVRGDRPEERARFATSSLLTFEDILTDDADVPCRVCGGPLIQGHSVRRRQWHFDMSHVQCGWLRVDETDLHERRRPGTFFSYWEWRCPTCGLDACAVRRPRDDDNMQCKRCKPRAELEVGAPVEIVHALRFRVGRGKRPRLVQLDAYARGRVLKLSGELALVSLTDKPEGQEVWVRAMSLSTL